MTERTASSGHIVVCGLEGLSLRTIEELDRMGERVVVIAHDAEPRFRGPTERLGVRIVDGEPQDPEVLAMAEVATARAMVLTTQDDVGNLHAALAARAINPGIHLVVRVFDEDFGQRVEELLLDSIALSASAIAVAGFVSAVVDDDEVIHLDVLGHRLVVRHADATDTGFLVPIGDDRRTPVVVFPPPGPGLLSLVDTGPIPTAAATSLRRRSPLRFRRPRFDVRFRWLALALGLLVLVSALVFQALANASPVDAVYNAVKAFFGGVDESVAPTPALRIFAIILILVGAAGLATLYALIADAILSWRLSNILGDRLPDARDHVIIIGMGTIGFRIADALTERGIAVVAAEKQADSRFVVAARKLGIPVIAGDARDPEVLRTLGIERARCVVAATDDDSTNLTTSLHARTQRPDMRVVVRLFDPDLAERLGAVLGEYRSRSVSALAGPAFATAAIGREAIGTIPVGDRRLIIVARMKVESGAAADGSTVGAEERIASEGDRGGCQLLAVDEGGAVRWGPADDEPVRAGQDLVVVATRRGLATVVTRTQRA